MITTPKPGASRINNQEPSGPVVPDPTARKEA
jgi:hypothetical protein